MENVYAAYTKVVNNVTFYFVKRYNAFPEYKDVPPILDAMGMHTDFFRACDIAKIYDETIVNKLLDELHIIPNAAKVIPINGVKAITHTLIKNTHQAILKWRFAGIN